MIIVCVLTMLVEKSSDGYQGRREIIRGEKKRKLVNRKKAGTKVYGPGMAD